MPQTIHGLLAESGIPESCPTCRCPIWKVQADTDEGIRSVECEQCRRTYVRGSTLDQLKVLVGRLQDATFRTRSPEGVERAYDAVRVAFGEWRERPGASVLYLINHGAGAEDEQDELPF